MADSSGNKHFIAGLGENLFSADSELELPLDIGYQFVRRMDEVIPLSPRRVSKHLAGVAPPVPVVRHLVMVDRHRKFLTREIGH
jgi:hypothetical protein